jgi:hypothetical protein
MYVIPMNCSRFGPTGSTIQTPFESGAAETAIAISNTSQVAATVNLDVTNLNGVPSTTHASLTIPPGAQITRFLKQIPGFESLPSPTQGILRVTTADPSTSVVVAVIRGRYNERGRFLFSGIPLMPDPPASPDAELIVPQFADGAGFKTSFVFGNNSSATVNVLLRILSPSGQPVKPALR